MNFQNKKIKLLTLFLVACQSVLFALLAAFFIGRNYNYAISDYPNVPKTTFYLKNVADTQQSKVLNFLAQQVIKNKLVIVRADQSVGQNGSIQETQLGIMGEVDKHPLPLTFAGHTIIRPETLKKLLQSPDTQTIGNALDYKSIAKTPNFAGGQHLTVFKLEDLVKQNHSINGTYQVIGLSGKQQVSFLTGLAKCTQKSRKQLQMKLSGLGVEQSMMPTILLTGLALNILGLLVLFLLNLLQSLALLGDLVLLGWSKVNFLLRLYLPYVITAFAMSIVTVPLGTIISGKYLSLWSLFFTVNLISTALVVLLALLASSLVMNMSFLDILKHKFPRKALLSLSILGYILLSGGIIFGSYALDGPLQTLNNTYQMSKSWQDVSHLTILKSSQFSKQNQSKQEAFKKRSKDFYKWYKDIYQENGVYLVGTTIYTTKMIEDLVAAGTNMPSKKPFLKLTVSPNYLKELGITVSTKKLEAAEQGKRLYLLPSSLSLSTTTKFKKWLQKDDTQSISPQDTPTVFNQQRQFIFGSYRPQTDFFTWATKTAEPLRMKRAIILVATPANMSYFESDNLSAQGFGGLAKFSTSKMSNTTKKKIFSNPRISPYKPAFTTIGNYIKGIQKDLSYTLYLFGIVGIILLALSLVMIYAIIKIYQVSQQELFNIKKFLGYSIYSIYTKPLAFLSITFVVELLTTIFIRSKAGTLVIIIKFIIQILFCLLYLRQSSTKQLLYSLKEE